MGKGETMNSEVLRMQFRIIKYSLLAMVAVMALSFFVLKQPKPFIIGVLFGTLISILNFRSMAITMERAVTMNSGSASAYATVMYFVRMLIYAAVLYVSIRAAYIHVLGTVIGLVIIKLVIYIENFIHLHSKKE